MHGDPIGAGGGQRGLAQKLAHGLADVVHVAARREAGEAVFFAGPAFLVKPHHLVEPGAELFAVRPPAAQPFDDQVRLVVNFDVLNVRVVIKQPLHVFDRGVEKFLRADPHRPPVIVEVENRPHHDEQAGVDGPQSFERLRLGMAGELDDFDARLLHDVVIRALQVAVRAAMESDQTHARRPLLFPVVLGLEAEAQAVVNAHVQNLGQHFGRGRVQLLDGKRARVLLDHRP